MPLSIPLHALALLLLTAASATAGRSALTAVLPIPSDAHSYNVQIATLALQGLANRASPCLFLDTPVFWSSNTSQAWLRDAYLVPQLGFDFTPVVPAQPGALLCALLAALPAGTAAGVALYDDAALDASRWLAVTAAALQALLPASRAMLADPLLAPCLGGLPVAADFSTPPSGVTSNAGAVAWGLRALRPACDAASAYSAGHSFADATEAAALGSDPAIDIGLDLAVARRLFVFNLSPDSARYPQHAATWEAVVASLAGGAGAVPSLLGWAEPEPAMTMSTSKAGGAVVCDGAPNLSFWAALALALPAAREGAPEAAPPQQQLPYHRSAAALDAGACYVTLQSNEGDTPKIAAALQQNAWLDPRRGSVPVAWGVDPLTWALAPGLWGFYASTATANDTFFAATAGAGYAYPWSMPSMGPYVARAAQLAASFTLHWPDASWHIDIWDNNRLGNLSSYAALFAAAGAKRLGSFSMQPEELPGFSGALPDGTPVIIAAKDLWYPALNASAPLADLRARVAAVCAAGPRPRFALVYGNLLDGLGLNLLDYALAVRDMEGGPEGVRVVGMQDLTALARQAAGA